MVDFVVYSVPKGSSTPRIFAFMGRSQTFALHTLGCKLNFSETSTIGRSFENAFSTFSFANLNVFKQVCAAYIRFQQAITFSMPI